MKLCIITDCNVPESFVAKYQEKLKKRIEEVFQEDFSPKQQFEISVLTSLNLKESFETCFENQKKQIIKISFLGEENFAKIENSVMDFAKEFDAFVLIKNKNLEFLAPKIYAFEKLGKYCISFDIEN